MLPGNISLSLDMLTTHVQPGVHRAGISGHGHLEDAPNRQASSLQLNAGEASFVGNGGVGKIIILDSSRQFCCNVIGNLKVHIEIRLENSQNSSDCQRTFELRFGEGPVD